MKHLILSLCLIVIVACRQNQVANLDDNIEQARRDSMTLFVAIYPCQNCLPLYYAEAKGTCPKEIQFVHLNTMEDCDTALTHYRAQVVSTDLARVLYMRKDGYKSTVLAQMPVQWKLLTAKEKRITTIKQLKERVVALARHCETDYHSDRILQKYGMEQLELFRTQFNNHRLRMDMLRNALVEAAFLNEPFATVAIKYGARIIWESDTTQQGWNVLAASTTLLTDKYRCRMAKELINIYQETVKELQIQPDTLLLRTILKKDYMLPHEEVDTIPSLLDNLIRSQGLLQPLKEETVTEAKAWLMERNRISNTLGTDSLFTLKMFEKDDGR